MKKFPLISHVVDNKYLTLDDHYEKQGFVRVAEELMRIFKAVSENDSPPTKLLKNEIKLNHYKAWLNKVQHAYLQKIRKNVK